MNGEWTERLKSWKQRAEDLCRQIKFSSATTRKAGKKKHVSPRAAKPRGILRAAEVAAAAVSEFRGSDEMLRRSLHEILLATKMDAGMVYLKEEGDDAVRLAVSEGLPERLAETIATAVPDESLIGALVSKSEVTVIQDLKTWSHPGSSQWAKQGYRCFAGAPVIHGERVLGAIGLVSKRKGAFAKSERGILESIGSILGGLHHQAQYHKDLRDALISMRRMSRVTSKAKASRNLEETLEQLARAVSEATFSLSSMITLMDKQGCVSHRFAFGYTRQALQVIPQMDRVSGRVLRNRECLFLSTPEEIRDSVGRESVEAGFASGVCVPILAGERPMGTLWLNYEAPRTIPDWELEQIQGLADWLGTRIENSRVQSADLEKLERYKSLHEHCIRIAEARKLEDVLRRLAKGARDLVGAGTALVSLSSGELAEDTVSPVRKTTVGGEERASSRDRTVISAARAYLEQPHALHSTQDGSEESPEKNLPMDGLLARRLLDEEKKPLGFLIVGDRLRTGDFTQEDDELLGALAGSGIIAIQNAKGRERDKHAFEEYRILLDQAPVAVATIDRNQMIVTVNKGFEGLTGFSREELEGKVRLCELLPEVERKGDETFWKKKAQDSSNGQGSEATLVTKNGDQKGVMLVVGDLQNSGSMAVCMTDPHVAQTGEGSSVAKGNLSLETFKTVLAGLQRPIARVSEHVETLVHQRWTQNAQERLVAISEEIEACRHVYEGFRILVEPPPLTEEPLNINELITNLIDLRIEGLRRDNIGVILRLDANLPPISADAAQLRWMLESLVENCRQAMQENEGVRALTVQTDRKGKIGRAIIKDTRPSPAADALESLFQISGAECEEKAEQNLSLAACRILAEQHGWRLCAECDDEEGLAFFVEYPLPEEPPEEGQGTASPERAEARSEEDPQAPRDKRVLIIDDEAVVIELLSYYLRSEGLVVETALDGRDALMKLKENTYDLILCDLRLPYLSGKELFEWIEANKPELAPRVIFVTGDVATPEAVSFLEESGSLWLEKPFDLTELKKAIAEVLNKAQG